eukprot:jgi/Chrpa1/19231/Chrysochromulina_OHIO_Genome00025282-RA
MHARALARSGPYRATTEPPLFAIITCIRSTPLQSLEGTSLMRTFLPSIESSITPLERVQWTVRLYLCADDDDETFRTHWPAIEAAAPARIGIRMILVPKVPNRVPSREAAECARLDGAEYYHRTNDDIRYLSAGWLTASVRALRRLSPPNVGIVGPKVYGDGVTNKMHGGMTIDIVHRTHLRIFREYYPLQLDNWYTDSWIVYVYVRNPFDRAKRVVKLGRADNFSAMHAFEKRRYSPTKAHLKLLPALTECGRQAISAYLNATSTGSRPDGYVSCRAYQKLPKKPSSSSIGVSSSSAGTRGRGGAYHRCSRRKEIIGGLEMNIKDLQANAMAIEGFCREREPRANWTLGEQLGGGAPPRSTSTCTTECA